MEQEAVPPQPAAPTAEPPAAVAAPPVPTVAAVARSGAIPGAALSPETVRALAPHAGNAAIARMLVAREPAAAGGPSAATPAAPAGPPPRLGLPGGIPLALPAGPGRIAGRPAGQTIKALDKRFGISVPLGPVQGEIGGTLSGLARYGNGAVDVNWERPPAPLTDPLAVKDTVSVNGSFGATGSVAGGLYASIGLGSRLVAGTRVTATGMLQAAATGDMTAKGTLSRDGANGQWTGDVDWAIKAQGSLTAAAAGYFEWNLLWLEGRKEIFRLESFPIATITVRLGGKLKPDGSVVTTVRDFELTRGAPPQPRPIGAGAAPAGGQPATVAPKRRDAGAPPEEPRPGANVLARVSDEQAGAQPPAAAAPPTAAAPPAEAAAPGAEQGRPPAAIAGAPAGGDVASELVASPEPEGVEP